MSKPPSTTPSGVSKSAAKKRAKKAAKATANPSSPVGEINVEFGSNPASDDPPFNLPPGSYPPGFNYNTGDFYEENPPPTNASPFTLPFPFDYSNFSGQPNIGGGFNITHDDLVQTANELYRRMADPNFGSDDAYWSSLPPHLRQFIREAVPFSGSTNRGTVSEGQQGMWTMAQQIVHAASQGMGLGPGVGANLLAGVNGRHQPLGEELGFHRHPDAKDDEYDDEEDFDMDEQVAPNGDAPKKKKKNKKKKPVVEPPVVKQPPRQVPPQPPTQPSLHPPPPPTPAPPSSRAAGKQPMTTTNPPARSARAAGKAPAAPHNHAHHNHPPPSKPAKGKAPANAPPAKIWTQASVEDRENIRHFWLALNEAERRDLLQIEKDAVLRKMKEQHRHSCGCAVCGRKKVNIESELDQLYEQYYDELRHYAAEQRAVVASPGAGPFPGSVEVDATGQVTRLDHRAPDPRALAPDDLIDDASEDYDDEDYDDEDDLDDDEIGSDEADVGDDEPPPQPPRQTKPMPKAAPKPDGADDFSTFGSNLATIKGESFPSRLSTAHAELSGFYHFTPGGILTVADDLLKNDGAKFLEMMEQLAVARSIREEQNIRDMESDEEYEE